MEQDPGKPHRRSIRLHGYDYSLPGWYYVTKCTHGRDCLFGEVRGGEMRLSEFGVVVQKEWARSAQIRREVVLDEFRIMPNHMHAIVVIREAGDGTACTPRAAETLPVVGATGRSPLQRPRGPGRRSLGSLMAGFGSTVTTIINALRGTPGARVWQRNYYERVIRDEESLARIRFYIRNNPAVWASDKENPARVGEDEFDVWLASLRDSDRKDEEPPVAGT